MKLEKLSATAELVSSVAIVVTLGYLAVQTQQNTMATQAAVRQSMGADDRALIYLNIDHPELITGRTGGTDLSDSDLVRLGSYLLASIRARENQWLQYQNGVIDERTWLTYRAAIPAVFSTEFFRSWWRNRSARQEFDEEFIEMVDDLLAANPLPPAQSIRERMGFDPL